MSISVQTRSRLAHNWLCLLGMATGNFLRSTTCLVRAEWDLNIVNTKAIEYLKVNQIFKEPIFCDVPMMGPVLSCRSKSLPLRNTTSRKVY